MMFVLAFCGGMAVAALCHSLGMPPSLSVGFSAVFGGVFGFYMGSRD